MNSSKLKLTGVILILFLFSCRQEKTHLPENIVWNTPSESSKGSMPIGNGDIGLNVWATENGTISFFIGKTDAWEENGRLLKIGKVNITLSPNPFIDTATFEQTLNIIDGTIEIHAGAIPESVKLKIWVDANHPVIHFDANVPENMKITTSAEIWRHKADTMKTMEFSDLNFYPETYGLTIIQPDIVPDLPGKIT